ncbi:tetratricopeptide repeat-containing protein [Brevundimonas sp.]|uniref:tetratricopeptide repeat-containing protein n=1 Tax=Brevundimonas sp. TaxID=1871086 RepID=UPI002FC72A4F
MTPSPPPVLPTIIALARSGALDRARRLFDEAGLSAVTDDPATLSVHGRLLKDEARRSPEADRPRLWREAGDAYARAADLSGATYHLINAATLALLAGDGPTAEERAQRVLAKLDAGDTGPETPYYLGATRAEALLLLGRTHEAQAALEAACRLAPEAWEDHASTLRQFSLVLETLGADAGWLGPMQPPRSLHFAGHMGVVDSPDLRARIDAILAEERIGFAWGALAGGADVIVAEAVLARGAELHLVLPAPAAVFRAESAAPLGGDWPRRFDAVLARATSVRVVEPGLAATTMLHIRLAAEIAMGRAAMKAASLASEAVQLLLTDPESATSATSLIGGQWRRSGRRQAQLDLPRPPAADGRARSLPERPRDGVLAAMLAVSLDERTGGDVRAALARVAEMLAGASTPLATPAFVANVLHLAFPDPAAAADAANLISREFGSDAPRIAGHYGVAQLARSPFGDGPMLFGSGAGLTSDLLVSTPAGAIHVTESFAAALNGWTPMTGGECPYVGELSGAGETIPLYALTRTGL